MRYELRNHKNKVKFQSDDLEEVISKIRTTTDRVINVKLELSECAVYSDWAKRTGYWYLDNLEIIKTKGGNYRLWDIKTYNEIGFYTNLKEAKNHGLKLINQKRG